MELSFLRDPAQKFVRLRRLPVVDALYFPLLSGLFQLVLSSGPQEVLSPTRRRSNPVPLLFTFRRATEFSFLFRSRERSSCFEQLFARPPLRSSVLIQRQKNFHGTVFPNYLSVAVRLKLELEPNFRLTVLAELWRLFRHPSTSLSESQLARFPRLLSRTGPISTGCGESTPRCFASSLSVVFSTVSHFRLRLVSVGFEPNFSEPTAPSKVSRDQLELAPSEKPRLAKSCAVDAEPASFRQFQPYLVSVFHPNFPPVAVRRHRSPLPSLPLFGRNLTPFELSRLRLWV